MKERLIQCEAEATRARRAIANSLRVCRPDLTGLILKACGSREGNHHDYFCKRLFPKTVEGHWCPCTCYNHKYIIAKVKKALKAWEDRL
jgi:hypothetical protein